MERSLIAFDSIFPNISIWPVFLDHVDKAMREIGSPVFLEPSEISERLLESFQIAFPDAPSDCMQISTDASAYVFKDHPLLIDNIDPQLWHYKLGVFQEMNLIRESLGETAVGHFVEIPVAFSRYRDHAMLLTLLNINDINIKRFLGSLQNTLSKSCNLYLSGTRVGEYIFLSLKDIFPNLPATNISTEAEWQTHINSMKTGGIIFISPTSGVDTDLMWKFNKDPPPECDISFKSSVWTHKLTLLKESETFTNHHGLQWFN